MIGDCPKCGDRMIGLFQTPRCERCELGGSPDTTPVYYAVVPTKAFDEEGYSYCGVFKDKSIAMKWAEHASSQRALDVATLHVRHIAGPLKWIRNNMLDFLNGHDVMDATVAKTEEIAKRFAYPSSGAFVVRSS